MGVGILTGVKTFQAGGSATGDSYKTQWVEQLGRLWPVAKGSISEVHKPCNRPNCPACREGRRHRAFAFSYSQDGRSRCAYVPSGAVESMRQALANGRELERRMVTAGLSLLASERARLAQTRPGVAGSEKRASSWKGLRVGVLSELDVLAPNVGYYRDVAGKMLRELRARGMAPTLYCGTVQPGEVSDAVTCPEFWDAVEQGRLDAVVILDVPVTAAWYARVQKLSIPAIGAATSFELGQKTRSMIVPALRELRRQGASRIALLTWDHINTVPVFEKALADLGLVSSPRWIGGEFNPALPGTGWEAFRDLWNAETEKPDGLLITDDVLFRDAALAIPELGIEVPAQLRIVTHANRSIPVRTTSIPHTRFEFDPQYDVQALANLLERRLAGEATVEPMQVPFTVAEVGEGAAFQERSVRDPDGAARNGCVEDALAKGNDSLAIAGSRT